MNRQNAMTQANALVHSLALDGRYAEKTEDEVAAEIIRLADEYFYPYAAEGKKP